MAEPTALTEPGIRVDRYGLHVISDHVSKKLAKKKLSPSAITGLNKCAASWLADSFVMRDIITEEPDNAARRGSLFHKIMEDLFALPPEDRTHDAVKILTKKALTSEEFGDMAAYPEAVAWLREAINGYYRMGGDPTKVEIASIPDSRTGELKKGLEIFVDGKIGNTERPILGFIDRLIVNPKNPGSVVIEDWKSGAKAKRWNPKTKSDDGLGEARQQIIYAMLLKQQGVNVSGARLIFPVPQEVVTVDLNDEVMNQRVIADIEDADKKLTIMTENNTFEYTPGFLCAWCSLAKICPKAQIKPYAKMQEAYAKQPEPEVLAKGFEFGN